MTRRKPLPVFHSRGLPSRVTVPVTRYFFGVQVESRTTTRTAIPTALTRRMTLRMATPVSFETLDVIAIGTAKTAVTGVATDARDLTARGHAAVMISRVGVEGGPPAL